MAKQQLTRHERDRLRKRNEILAAALELFSESGFHNVSVAEIAEKSEYPVGTIYKLFEDKEGLYVALVLEKMDEVHSALLAALNSDTDAVGRIRAFIRAKGEAPRRNVAVVRLLQSESCGVCFNIPGRLHKEVTTRYERFMLELSGVFREGIEKNMFRDCDPVHLAVAIEGLTNAFVLAWLEDPDGQAYENNVQVIEDLFFDGILNRETD